MLARGVRLQHQESGVAVAPQPLQQSRLVDRSLAQRRGGMMSPLLITVVCPVMAPLEGSHRNSTAPHQVLRVLLPAQRPRLDGRGLHAVEERGERTGGRRGSDRFRTATEVELREGEAPG